MSQQIFLPRFVVCHMLLVLRQVLYRGWLICQLRLHIPIINNFLAAINNLRLVDGHAPIMASAKIQRRRKTALRTHRPILDLRSENLIMLIYNFLLCLGCLKNLYALLMVPHLIVDLFFNRILISDVHWIKTRLLNYSLNYWVFAQFRLIWAFFEGIQEHLVALNRDENFIFLKKV